MKSRFLILPDCVTGDDKEEYLSGGCKERKRLV